MPCHCHAFGSVTLQVCAEGSGAGKGDGGHEGGSSTRAWCHVVEIEPTFCEAHWLYTRARMRDDSSRLRTLVLDWEGCLWDLRFSPRVRQLRLKGLRISGGAVCGFHDYDAQLSFEWMPTMTEFMKRCY